MKTMQLREFTKTDWHAFAGAETEHPRVADRDDLTIIEDGPHVEVHRMSEDCDLEGLWTGYDAQPHAGAKLAERLVERFNRGETIEQACQAESMKNAFTR